MSSTGRNDRGGEGADFFPTPAWVVKRLLEELRLPGGLWVEPAAGDGAIIRAVNSVRSDVLWEARELRPECTTILSPLTEGRLLIGDALASPRQRTATVCITNPPFSLAMQFIELGMALAPIVVMLLRTNFLGSEERAEFMRTKCPDIYSLPNRPSFRADGGTDSIEYSWFVWREYFKPRDFSGSCGKIRVLATTSIAERKADRRASAVVLQPTQSALIGL